MIFQPVSIGIELPIVTSGSVGIGDRNLTRQVWFCFLNFVLLLAVDRLDL